jgi:NhaA family Na+:H+ antiporter
MISTQRFTSLDFLKHEAAGGTFLLLAAVLAVVCANSALATLYGAFLDTPVVVQIGALKIAKPLLLWINDGLMAIFFFLVGLEIKRELLIGELSSFERAFLPAVAALGGMVAPAIVYATLNWGDARAMQGWAIPTATDIAFAVGLLAVLGSRVPTPLKIFLLALAIIDDLGAIIIIAVFYTDNLSLTSLGLALIGTLALAVLSWRGVTRLAPYLLIGLFIWVCVLKSGVHATLAGVVVALFIPLRGADEDAPSPLASAEHALHPWVAFGVLPLFAFANAGVSFSGGSWAKLLEPIPLGIALGLFLGKQIGIVGATWLAVRAGVGRLPDNTSWAMIWGLSLVAGIGFTMSLFIGTLAFPDGGSAADVRIGVIAGSLLSAITGYVVLSVVTRGYSNPASDKNG